MQQLRKQNALLLKLVTTLQSQINSKTRQNQLLYQQYEQLVSQNHDLQLQINTLKKQHRQLRRSSFTTKEQPRYTYAVLNSPRTEKLQLEIIQLKKSLSKSAEENERLTKQIVKLNEKVNGSNQLSHDENKVSQLTQRIGTLQQNLSKKEKEMQELTLIMYAKDSYSAQISQKQTQKNQQIKKLTKQLSQLQMLLKQQENRMNQAILQKDNRAYQLQSMINNVKQQLVDTRCLLKTKDMQMEQLQSIIAIKSNTLEDLSSFMNQQAAQLQLTKEQLQKITNENASYLITIDGFSKSIKLNEQMEANGQIMLHLQQKMQETQKEVKELENNKVIMAQIIKNLQEQILMYNQQILEKKTQIKKLQEKTDELLTNTNKKIQQAQFYQHLIKQSRQKYQQQKERAQIQINNLLKDVGNISKIIDINKILSEKAVKLQQQIEQSNKRAKEYKDWAQKQLNQKDQSIQVFMDILQKLQSEIRAKDSQINQIENRNKEQIIPSIDQTQSVSKLIEQLVLFLKNARNQTVIVCLQKLNKLYIEQRNDLQGQGQELRKSFSDLLTENNNLKQQIDSFNQSLDILNALITQKSQQIQKMQQNQKVLKRQLQSSYKLYEQAKSKPFEQSMNTAERVSVSSHKKKSGDNLQRQQYVQMLNAVIQSIKNQHQQSITKIQNKNMIIYQLEKRLKQTQDNYQHQITTLRNSIFNQSDAVSYQQLAQRYSRLPKEKKDANQEQIDQLLKEIDALREQIKSKDQQLKAKDAQLSIPQSINKSEQRILFDSQKQVEANSPMDNNSKPSNIAIENSQADEQSHHFYQQNRESSRIYLQNQQMQQTISQQNYIIMQLQDNLIKMQNQYNSEIIMLKRNIAQLNAEIIILKKTLYEANPKSLDLTTFIKPNRTQTSSFRLNSQSRCQSNYFRPASHQNNSSFERHYPVNVNYDKTSIFKKNPLQNSSGLQRTIKQGAGHKNPYIQMMTNEKGQLKFPQNGNWSIQQLRSLLQQSPK